MSLEKTTAIIVRALDWSETSRIATLWTRDFGKVRVLAKGGRRLRSNFEIALDLLAVCSIVFVRKSTAGLDLLTEAQGVEQFPHLRSDLSALYAGYYVAELLSDWTQDYDPHPALFDSALQTLRDFGLEPKRIGSRLAAFELGMIQELGYRPILTRCADCEQELADERLAFSAMIGGMLCATCQPKHRDRIPISRPGWERLRELSEPGDAWRRDGPTGEVRRLLGQYIAYLMNKRPKMLAYLTNLS